MRQVRVALTDAVLNSDRVDANSAKYPSLIALPYVEAVSHGTFNLLRRTQGEMAWSVSKR